MSARRGRQRIRRATTTRRMGAAAALTVVLAATAGAGTTTPEQDAETFRATAQHVGTGPSGQANAIIQISRWSSDDERGRLARVLVEDGSDALAQALDDHEDVGFIRFPAFRAGPPSTRLRYARQFRDGDRRIIVLATDRPIGWAEAVVRPQQPIDNRVTLIELVLDADNQGEGVLAIGVEIAVDGNSVLRISNASSHPIRLTNVRRSD